MKNILLIAILFYSYIAIGNENKKDTVINDQRTLMGYVNLDTLFILEMESGQKEIIKISDNKSGFWESCITSLKWNSNKTEIWGVIVSPGSIDCFFKYNYTLKRLDKYKVPKDCKSEFDINPNLGELLYSDYPFIIDALDSEELLKSKKPIKLYVLNFKTNEKTLIATNQGKEFRPIWINNEMIEINSSDNDKRVEIRYKK